MLKLFIRLIAIMSCSSSIFSPSIAAQERPLATYFNVERVDKIESYINKGMVDERIPGVAVALIEAGEVVYIKGFGVADANATPVTQQTPFQLASITKSFSALLMLQMEQEGKLSLSDPVIDHIPWFATANTSQSDRITIRHLLQHNSGLSTASGNLDQNTTYRGADATELSVKRLRDTQLRSEPGTSFEYSNSNYHIVSHIVEVVEGKPFEQVMAERILQPLDMHNSYVQVPDHKTQKAANGFPHWFGFPIERPFILGRMKMGDGGMVSSAEDLSKYLLEVTHGQSDLVSKEMRENLLNPEHNNGAPYALGWEISSDRDRPTYQHGGTNGGFSNLFGFADSTEQRNDIGFVILTNYSSALNDQFVWNLRNTIFDYAPMPKKLNMTNLVSLVLLYGTILILVFALYRTLIKKSPNSVSVKSFIVPILLMTYSYVIAYVVPGMHKINLLSIYPFFPDLAVGMIGCALLSLVLALVKLLLLWKGKVST